VIAAFRAMPTAAFAGPIVRTVGVVPSGFVGDLPSSQALKTSTEAARRAVNLFMETPGGSEVVEGADLGASPNCPRHLTLGG
jgi:hypothetical protein